MKMLSFWVIFILALAAISFGPGGGGTFTRNQAWGQDLKNPPLAKNAAEMKIFKVLDEIKHGPWMANVATLHGRLLRILTEAVNAQKVVEIGTSNLLFIDADKPGYLDYLNRLLPLVRPGGMILADNMSQPRPSPDFVKAITTNPNLETIFLNMQSTGIGLTLKKR
jgi:predicted O-methyltransferase YrrM